MPLEKKPSSGKDEKLPSDAGGDQRVALLAQLFNSLIREPPNGVIASVLGFIASGAVAVFGKGVVQLVFLGILLVCVIVLVISLLRSGAWQSSELEERRERHGLDQSIKERRDIPHLRHLREQARDVFENPPDAAGWKRFVQNAVERQRTRISESSEQAVSLAVLENTRFHYVPRILAGRFDSRVVVGKGCSKDSSLEDVLSAQAPYYYAAEYRVDGIIFWLVALSDGVLTEFDHQAVEQMALFLQMVGQGRGEHGLAATEERSG